MVNITGGIDLKKIKKVILKGLASLIICALVIVGTSTNSYAYSVDFSAKNAKGYVTIQGETFYVEKTTSPNGLVDVVVTDKNNVVTESKTFGDTVQVQKFEKKNGKKHVLSTQVISTKQVKHVVKNNKKKVHANESTLTDSKATAAGYSYLIYSDKLWVCSNSSNNSKYVKYTSTTKSNLENFRSSVNTARNIELKLLASGTSALLGAALTVATAGLAAVISIVIGGGGTLTTVTYIIDYNSALDNCKYYYNLLESIY